MVISSEHPGLEVKVCVRGQQLQEYDDDEDAVPKTTTKYIEARSDDKFAVVFTFMPPFPNQHHVRASLYIDGVRMNNWLSTQEDLFRKPFQASGVCRQQNGEWVMQKFCFAKLDTVEEARGSGPSVTDLRQALSKKGCITVSFKFVESFQDLGVYPRSTGHGKDALETLREIPEKALKGDALSHQAVLSKAEKCRGEISATTRTRFEYLDKEPFATSHFKYRALASLKALRLVTVNEPLPISLEDRPEEELTPAELRELLRRVRQRESEGVTVKQEPEPTARVKRERAVDDGDEVTYVETR